MPWNQTEDSSLSTEWRTKRIWKILSVWVGFKQSGDTISWYLGFASPTASALLALRSLRTLWEIIYHESSTFPSLYSALCATCFNPHSSPERQVSLAPFYRRGNWGQRGGETCLRSHSWEGTLSGFELAASGQTVFQIPFLFSLLEVKQNLSDFIAILF